MRRLAIAALLGLLLAFLVLHSQRDAPPPAGGATGERRADIATATRRLQAEIAALAPQRPRHPDLYVLGIAGDGTERVFLNEVRHLHELAGRRLDARGRVLLLSNHPPESPYRLPVPATPATIRAALAGIGAVMDPAEDILLLYITTHGSSEHWLLLRRDGLPDGQLDAPTLRAALDDAGIRHRVLALSACYAGGLAPALQSPDTLVLAAAREDRTSFGCGNDSVATFFGRAWLVDGLNATVDFASAFRQARTAIREREAAEDYSPSRPQIRQGDRIGKRLQAWRDGFRPGPAVPYPHAEPTFDDVVADDPEHDDGGDEAWYGDADGTGDDEVYPPLLPMAVLVAREMAALGAADAVEASDAGVEVSAAERPAGDKPSKP